MAKVIRASRWPGTRLAQRDRQFVVDVPCASFEHLVEHLVERCSVRFDEVLDKVLDEVCRDADLSCSEVCEKA